MSLVINHNSMSSNVARNLNDHYGKLSTSTQRLSTGLRVNSAADDAAGLAIRELQRADIAALRQGARNANDAISMIQTADGALQIIDEKLIRMKELAEQAATGTYDSTQRLMIDSEFQAMASEIDRIANATDFNGIHLLNGNLSGAHNGAGLNSTGAMKIHFGTGNDAAEDYYYIDIGDCRCDSLFPHSEKSDIQYEYIPIDWQGAIIKDGKYYFEVTEKIANDWIEGIDSYKIPSGLKNVVIESSSTGYYHKPHVNLFSSDGTQLTGYSPDDSTTEFILNNGTTETGASSWWNSNSGESIIDNGRGNEFLQNARYEGTHIKNDAGDVISYNGLDVKMITQQSETNHVEVIHIDEITDNLVFLIGGHANNVCNKYDLKITCEVPYTKNTEKFSGIPDIRTQQGAQEALDKINYAITTKDKIRAHLGALQNRLENTISNLNIQAENLLAAESRISDVDVATEMTEFVREQILTQASVAMLSQANSMPKMAMQLISG